MDTRIAELLRQYPEPWVIEKEPHSYNDGTKEFTHVRYRAKRDWAKGEEVCIEIGSHVTPDLAELLILLRTNADLLSGAGWRADWDNAPRDGTEILIAGPDIHGSVSQVVAAWDVEEVGGDGGWATDHGLSPVDFTPEFWMPIPRLPKQSQP